MGNGDRVWVRNANCLGKETRKLESDDLIAQGAPHHLPVATCCCLRSKATILYLYDALALLPDLNHVT